MGKHIILEHPTGDARIKKTREQADIVYLPLGWTEVGPALNADRGDTRTETEQEPKKKTAPRKAAATTTEES